MWESLKAWKFIKFLNIPISKNICECLLYFLDNHFQFLAWSEGATSVHFSGVIWLYLTLTSANLQDKSKKSEDLLGENFIANFSVKRSLKLRNKNQKQLLKDFLQNRCSLNFAIFTGKHLCWSLLLRSEGYKETPTQLFSCEYCEIFKDIFFIEHLR